MLRTQAISRRFCGSPAHWSACLGTCQSASLGCVEGPSSEWLVRCLGLGMWRCGAEAVHLQDGTPSPSRGMVGWMETAHPSWGPQPVPAQCDRLLLPQQQHWCCPAEPGCWQDSAGPQQCHQPPAVLHAAAWCWQLWHCHRRAVWYSGCWAN